jgi:hypothetical protein
MSKVKSFLYYIEYKDGSDETMNKNTLESLVDNDFDSVFNKIKKIVKEYRLQGESKKIYRMTLFTVDHDFSASDYIEHYQALRDKDKDEYGTDFLSDFDIELISMFNE